MRLFEIPAGTHADIERTFLPHNKECDRSWFRKHPRRAFRVRGVSNGEIPKTTRRLMWFERPTHIVIVRSPGGAFYSFFTCLLSFDEQQIASLRKSDEEICALAEGALWQFSRFSTGGFVAALFRKFGHERKQTNARASPYRSPANYLITNKLSGPAHLKPIDLNTRNESVAEIKGPRPYYPGPGAEPPKSLSEAK